MNLNFVIPDMEKTFGVLTFGGPGQERSQRINNRKVVSARAFNLFSSIQKADVVEVLLEGKAGPKNFPYETPVRLVGAEVIAQAKVVNNNSYVVYTLRAKDMVPAENDEMPADPAAGNPV